MEATTKISTVLLGRIMRAARASAGVEICGLLRGRAGRIIAAEQVANRAAAPADSFELDPAALIAAHRRARRAGGLELLGYFHSHPNGLAAPSARDAADAAADDKLWLIATAGAATLWSAKTAGALHGRFDPVAFDVMIGKRIVTRTQGVTWQMLPPYWSHRS